MWHGRCIAHEEQGTRERRLNAWYAEMNGVRFHILLNKDKNARIIKDDLMTHLTKNLKDQVRKRAHWTCANCGTKFPPRDHDLLTVHHTSEPVHGEHLIPLCVKCHQKAEKDEKDKKKANAARSRVKRR
jgi:5-methylcytosine-specific restriction endonuclease McrA